MGVVEEVGEGLSPRESGNWTETSAVYTFVRYRFPPPSSKPCTGIQASLASRSRGVSQVQSHSDIY